MTDSGPFAVRSTGFVEMAVEMIVILAFQSVYGYLYQWIGLLIAAFMAGLAGGAFLVTQILTRIRKGVRVFCWIEALQLVFVLVSTWGFVALHGLFLEKTVNMGMPKVVLFCMNVVAGFLVGSEFPLANREAAATAQVGSSIVGGRFYALDLGGAWLGTLLVSVLLVPLVGISNTLLFLAALEQGLQPVLVVPISVAVAGPELRARARSEHAPYGFADLHEERVAQPRILRAEVEDCERSVAGPRLTRLRCRGIAASPAAPRNVRLLTSCRSIQRDSPRLSRE